MTDFDFFWGAASGSAQKALRRLEEPTVMLNYATKNNQPWDGIERLFIDSGGYSFMKAKGEYDTTDGEYLDYIEEHHPERFALRDYPCESDVLDQRGTTVAEHQQATTERHISLTDVLEDRHIESAPVSVLQGWTADDYIEHLESLHDHGVLHDHVAVGSVCRRNAEATIRSILRQIRGALPTRCSLHAFGVKTSVLDYPGTRRDIDSADSCAYCLRQQKSAFHDGSELGTWQDVAWHYLDMKRRIEGLRGEGGGGATRQAVLPVGGESA